MQGNKMLLAGLSLVFALVLVAGCATTPKPTTANFKSPTVALSHVEIPYYVGYYYFANSVTP